MSELRRYEATLVHKCGENPYMVMASADDGDYCEYQQAADEITRLRQLLSEAEKREKELVAMLNSADESRLVQIRRAEASEGREKEARNVALEEAAAIVDAVSHEGLHNSMWRCRFERVAAAIRALQSEER